MSNTRLMILGLVSQLQPVHGYDIRKELTSWNVESWANVQPGSIYHALRKMAEEGLLEEVDTEQVNNRPARTRYRMTRDGEVEYQALLRKYWWEYREPVDPFLAAFSFLPSLPRAEAAGALRARARLLEGWSATYRDHGEEWSASKPPHVGWQFELTMLRCEAEARWCHDIAARIEAGEGMHVNELPEGDYSEEWRKSLRVQYGDPVDDEDE
ncbi:PadR family transcriptional regulator [Dactylosporangium fulvum]|uniref:PadR family transcriptional regulator n=1 Tax=Dactylosporangium fulvum TaxID=53359 RepID=A0ABY5W2K3_9ACTN|nr:PadR family transcriptional regulator [Dactylosporangium fulvum]UWP83679.1 PadR family transcriptional regulator [Dactylosporangium fulvum]